MKKHDNNTKPKGFLRKFATFYIAGMTKYLFPDAKTYKGEDKEEPKFKNDRDRIFFK